MVRNLKDAFYNAQYRVGQGIYTRAVSQGDNSLTESNFTGNDTFDTLIEDDTGALPEFVDSQISMSDAASNDVAMNKISASQTAMDAVAGSQTAMDAVAASQLALDTVVASQLALDTVVGSQTAMDAVAASQTARDVIGFSGLAYDTIANSNMAIGKYAIGYTTESPSDFADMDAVAASQTAMDAVASSQTAMDAVIASQLALDTVASSQTAMESVSASQTAMDAVSASQTAMDAVSASQTAMDAVSASQTAMDVVLRSQLATDTVWNNTLPSETIWDNIGTISGDATKSFVSNPNLTGGSAIAFTSSGSNSSISLTFTQDLTNVSTLRLWQKNDHIGTNWVATVTVGGDELLNDSGETSWTERNLDVSGYSGNIQIELRGYDEFGSGSDGDGPVAFAEMRLIE